MNTVRVQVTVTGTDDQGTARSFASSGAIVCSGATDGTITATTSKIKVCDTNASNEMPSWVYVENNGSVDIAIGYADTNGNTTSFAVPPGASQLFPCVAGGVVANIDNIAVWTPSSTASVRYILFY